MSVEDAAKIVISAGMVVPDYEARLKRLAERGIRSEMKRPPPASNAS